MNIEHIRAAREALEREVAKLFAEFRGKTGLAVTGCDVITVSGESLAELRQIVISERVALEIEQI